MQGYQLYCVINLAASCTWLATLQTLLLGYINLVPGFCVSEANHWDAFSFVPRPPSGLVPRPPVWPRSQTTSLASFPDHQSDLVPRPPVWQKSSTQVCNIKVHCTTSYRHCSLIPRPHPLTRKGVWWPLNDFLVAPSQQNAISHVT